MNILVSAYACNPTKGSEEAIGFHWTNQWQQHGQQVWCLTTPAGQADIEAYVRENSMSATANINFIYVSVPGWIQYLYRWQFGVYLHYLVWQYAAWRKARQLAQTTSFDVVHHASYGSLQMASQLWRLGKPLILGPLGGGQRAPKAFKRYLPDWFKSETMRNAISFLLVTFDPNVRQSLRRAALVLVTNTETANEARRLGAQHIKLFLDSGLPESYMPDQFPIREITPVLRILWLGRLISRKGLPVVLEALSQVNTRVPFHLTIIGHGPVGDTLPALIRQYGLEGRVTWEGALPWVKVRASFLAHDVFMFTSLRDSFASQFLEAMGVGLPIITLDHQGAHDFIPEAAALKVPVTTSSETIAALARAVEFCYDHPAKRIQMGQVGYAFARTQNWPDRTGHLLQLVNDMLATSSVAKPTVPA